MKIAALFGALILTVVLLIVAFQNIAVSASVYIFFGSLSMPLTVPILITAFVAGFTGALYTIFVQAVLRENQLDSEADQQADDSF